MTTGFSAMAVSSLGSQRCIRSISHPVEFLRVDHAGDVEAVERGLHHEHPRLLGRGADMRRRQHVGMAQQLVALRRLDREHVEAGRHQRAALELLQQRVLVDDAAAAAVDQHGAGLHLPQHLARIEPDRLLGLRQMQRQHLRARQQLVVRDRRRRSTACRSRRNP